jgi:hypothetical protein
MEVEVKQIRQLISEPQGVILDSLKNINLFLESYICKIYIFAILKEKHGQ